MIFNYSDLQLNYLNQDRAVYSVNSNFVKRNKEDDANLVISADPKTTEETNLIVTPDGQQFQVIATKSDSKTGFDGMAVAPIIDGEPDLKHVAIVVAGTDPNGIINKDTFNATLGSINNSDGYALSPQYSTSERFFNDVSNMEGVKVSQLTGYSQGAYVIKLGAKYEIPTTTFNAWFRYESLSDSEKEIVQK